MLLLLMACGPNIQELVEETWPDGSPKVVKHYVTEIDAKKLVKEISYYKTGIKRLEGEFNNGQRNGRWKYWYKDGTLWSEGFFTEGKRSGVGTTYHENGKKYIQGSYENGERVGKWSFWDENGKLSKEIDYDKQ